MSFQPKNFTVWAEIPVTNLERSVAFFNEVVDAGLTIDTSGPNPMAMFPTAEEGGVAGHLYEGKPASEGNGPTVHLAAPGKLEDTMERVKKSGGTVLSPIIDIPAGRFVYCLDLDGNSVGFFELS